MFTAITHVSTNTCTFDLEAESGSSLNQMNRSEASGGLTVRLTEGEVLQNCFTLRSSCSVSIENVAYLNDEIADVIQLSLNGTQLGRFRTVAQVGAGNYSNVILGTGAFGNHTQLLVGRYNLTLTVLEADTYGVEIDKVTLVVECTGSTECLEIEVIESTECGPSNEQSNGLTVGIIVTIVFGIVAIVIGLPSCLVALLKLHEKCV